MSKPTLKYHMVFKRAKLVVRVCDAVMGSGKTQSVISFINEHPEKRFLYITPYLDEARRIKDGCPSADFVEPEEQYQFRYSKVLHTVDLIKHGRNISSTHQALLHYTSDIVQLLKDQCYTIIIDEKIDVLTVSDQYSYDDFKVIERAGLIYKDKDGYYKLTDEKYANGKLINMLHAVEMRLLYPVDTVGGAALYCLAFPPNLFLEIDEIFVLTYLFSGSELESFFRMFDIEYTYIGVDQCTDGLYRFSKETNINPEWVAHIKELLHIEQDNKLNNIGENPYSLSKNWYQTRDGDNEDIEQLRKNLVNFFRNKHKDFAIEYRMVATFASGCWNKIRDKGYGRSNVTFNERAKNCYSYKRVLAYPINVFANRTVLNFYNDKGVGFDDDQYALSTIVQWIWRSAIRNGKEVWIYVPSKRMRMLLENWIELVSN